MIHPHAPVYVVVESSCAATSPLPQTLQPQPGAGLGFGRLPSASRFPLLRCSASKQTGRELHVCFSDISSSHLPLHTLLSSKPRAGPTSFHPSPTGWTVRWFVYVLYTYGRARVSAGPDHSLLIWWQLCRPWSRASIEYVFDKDHWGFLN